MEPLVSIIVPAWNCARWITATLESVYAQTYRNWEIILVDDGSTDDTRSMLDRHMVRLRYYYQENRGTAAARNAGLRKALTWRLWRLLLFSRKTWKRISSRLRRKR